MWSPMMAGSLISARRVAAVRQLHATRTENSLMLIFFIYRVLILTAAGFKSGDVALRTMVPVCPAWARTMTRASPL